MANSAFTHDPQITVPGSSTDNAIVIFDGTAGTGFGNSTIIVDSGGNGRIGIAADTNVITITSGVVTIAGTVAATTLTGAGAGITALAAANITASGTLPALNGAALTALSAANITASGTLPALVGTALTALDASNLSTGTLPAARIGNDSIDSQHYAPTSIDNEHLADDAVGIAELSATGTASSSTFLRGDNAWAAAGGGSLTLIGTAVASGSATLDITGLDSTYDTYLIAISDCVPAADGEEFLLQFGDSSGIDQGGSDYGYHEQRCSEASVSYVGSADSANAGIAMDADGVGNAGGEGLGAVVFLHRPGDGTTYPIISGSFALRNSSGVLQGGSVIGVRKAVITLDRIRVKYTGGNIATGRLSCWGIAHA